MRDHSYHPPPAGDNRCRRPAAPAAV